MREATLAATIAQAWMELVLLLDFDRNWKISKSIQQSQFHIATTEKRSSPERPIKKS